MTQPTAERKETTRRMRAVVQDRYGPPEEVLRLDEIDRPSIGPDEILVEMKATSVNTPDWITVTGIPYVIRLQAGLRKPPSPVRGTDIAGVVVAVGENVADLGPGDEVFGLFWSGDMGTRGTFAEFAVGLASQVIHKPPSLSFEEAGAAGMSGLTALVAIRDKGEVGPGKRVLINGASGGVGTFAVQIAKALGAEVTGVCSTRNVELVESLGADLVIDYTRDDFTTGDQRYDVILDNVMNRPPSVTTRVLTSDGIFMPNAVGNSGGIFAGLPRIARAGLMKFARTDVRPVSGWSPNPDLLNDLARMLESGDVRTVIDKAYRLDEAGQAVAHMYGHHARGNVVITP